MAEGELTPDEATMIGSVIEMKRRAIETVELEQRLQWPAAGLSLLAVALSLAAVLLFEP